MADRCTLTAARLRSLIDYDQSSGCFRWKRRSGRDGTWCNRDREAGSVNKQTGYRSIRVDKRLYQAHRLAWLYVYGEWPAADIDHINGARLDNRIANLRAVGNAINRQNMRRARRDSASGLIGAHFDKRRNVHFSSIRVDGKSTYLGAYQSAEAAHAAYVQAKRRLHVGC